MNISTRLNNNDSLQLAENASVILSRSYQLESFILFLEYFDIVLRCIGLLIHIVYFLLVLFVKELRKISLIYTHQINIYGLVFLLLYVCHIGDRATLMMDTHTTPVNSVVCTISEILWALVKYLRSYAILLLALFRMIAVIKPDGFKKWMKSAKAISLTIIVEYMACVALFVGTRFGFNTHYGGLLCQDGFTSARDDGIHYFVVTSLFGVALPNGLVIVSFVYTKYKFRAHVSKFSSGKGSNRAASNMGRAISSFQTEAKSFTNLNRLPTQNERLTRQYLFINVLLIISSITYVTVNFANLIPEFNTIWYQYRLVIRITSILFQNMIPIVSLYGHPKLAEIVYKMTLRKIVPK